MSPQSRTARRLAAILAADVVGYSRLMGIDEEGTLAALKAHRRELIDPLITQHQGRIVKTTGDGLLIEFPSIVDAVRCAVVMQQGMESRNANVDESHRIRFRIGINVGDVIVEGDDIFGDGVNVAARLEALAEPGHICVSATVREHVAEKLPIGFADLGEHRVKNIARPVHVFRIETRTIDFEDSGEETLKHSERKVRISRPGGVGSTTREISVPMKAGRTAIVVLPFMNLGSTSAQEHLADAITEDLTTGLSKIDSLFIISRTSAVAYKGKAISATEIGEELGADYIIEGSVQTAGNSVRINAQLIETRGGGHLWAEKFDGTLDAIFQFQDRITQKVVSALEVRFSEGEQIRLWREEAADAGAYDHFLRGRAYYKEYSRAGNARAKPEFQAALEITPRFVSAIVGLARTHIEDANYGWSSSREGSLAEGKRLLDRAFSINAAHGSAHAELAHFLMISGNYEAARERVLQAISIDPGSAEAQNTAAFVFLCLNLPREALKYARTAIELNPHAPEFYLIVMADAYMLLRRYDEALPLLETILAHRPGWIMARALLAICHEATGQHEEAHKIAMEISEMSPRFSVTRWRRCLHNPDRPDIDDSARMLELAGLPK
jgi:class 3 adenylate cyclase/TolB-like protein